MAFIRIPSLTGKLYVPEPCDRDHSKRPCPDCFGCQQCSEARCGVCRGECPPHEPAPGAPRPGSPRIESPDTRAGHRPGCDDTPAAITDLT